MRKLKSILAILCAMAIFSANIVMVQAENEEYADDNMFELYSSIFDGGTGTADDPYLISTQDQLAIINDIPSYSFKLVNDIEMTGTWNPIGYNGDKFSGTFDGDGYAIKNLTVNTNNNYAGLFYTNNGTIKNLKVITSEDGVKYSGSDYYYYVGIITGSNTGTISQCSSSGNVSGSVFAGKNSGTIENCYSTATHTEDILGTKNCYDLSSKKIETKSCYSTLSMKVQVAYSGWDFEDTWGLDANINDGYPYLLCEQLGNVTKAGAPNIFDGGDGSEDNPFLISTQSQLEIVTDLSNYNFKLVSDIELSGDWRPIYTFSGTFDGDGHSIKNLNISGNYYNAGLFANNYGTIKNLSVKIKDSGSVTSTNTADSCLGTIAGSNSGKITNCSSSGKVGDENTSYYTGGLVGFNYKTGIIENCYARNNVNGRYYTGGFCGKDNDGTIKNSYSVGTVTDTSSRSPHGFCGNSFGYGEGATITSCYYDQQVSGLSDTGRGEPKTTLGMKLDATYTDWDFDSTWGIDSDINDGYPYLQCELKNNSIPVTSVELSQTSATIYPGDVLDLTAVVNPSDATIQNVKWTSSDASVASVANGKVTAKKIGNVDITASAGGVSAVCKITVADGTVYVTGVKMDSPTLSIGLNETATVPARVVPENADNKALLWTTTDASIATVSDGVVTGISTGTAIITATSVDGGKSAQCVVTVIDKTVKVTGITLDTGIINMAVSEKAQLVATVSPENATNKIVSWSSTNPDIASVDSGTGEITGIAVGTAAIIATTSDGGKTAECTVNVSDNSIKVESVILDKYTTGMCIGETQTLKATVLPENATNKNIRWKVLDSNVATVSTSGVVIGKSVGTTQVYAESKSNPSCYAVCRVNVSAQKIAVTGISLNNNVFGNAFEVNIGKTLVFSPAITPSNATNQDIKWTSNDSSIAKVENGVVTGISEGSTTITATTVDGGYTASCAVKVTKPTVYVTGISLNVEQQTVPVKGTFQLQAAVTPSDATDKTITFESNNNAIAMVSDTGLVTGISAGTTLIKAISKTSAGTYVAFCTITVPKPIIEVTSIKLNKSSVEIVEGKTIPVKAVLKPTNATYKNVTWSSGDESIATVSQDGYITAMGVGETVISATAANGKAALCNVKVLSSDTPAQLKVENATVKAGKQIPITVSIAANPGISSFSFDLTYDNTKVYPVSYSVGDVLKGVNITTPLGSSDFKNKSSVRFLCMTSESKNMDTDGDLITVVFQSYSDIDLGDTTINIVPSSFKNQNYEDMKLEKDNCTLSITDYTIGDVNNDDKVDLKDSMLLAQYLAGFDVTITEQGMKAAVAIYPEDDVEANLNDLQHLFRYLSDWQVELGKKSDF